MHEESSVDPTDDEALLAAEFVAVMEAQGAAMPVIDSGTIDDHLADGNDQLEREEAVHDLATGAGLDVDGVRPPWLRRQPAQSQRASPSTRR